MIERLLKKAKPIRLLLMDCDGVLTDGKLYFSHRGEALKVFHVRDGQGLVIWHKSGFFSGIISGRNSEIVKIRADELGMHFLFQGVENKVEVFERICSENNFVAEEVAFVGDDLGDLDLMKKVGFSASVADAVEEVKRNADFITKNKGGCGAVREVIDFLLSAKNRF